MLKKRLGTEAVENGRYLRNFFIIPSSLIIPEGCEKIENSAFEGCQNLKRVVIPKSVKRIGNDAFCNCTGLKEVIISEGVKRIEEWAFEGCSSLREVVIPRSVEYIGDYAFYGCTDTDIILEKPESEFKEIASNAFFSCKYVKKEIRN